MRDLPTPIEKGERLGDCPSCGAEIRASMAPDPDNDNRPTRCVLHAIPFCHYFGVTDAAQIERDVRDGRKNVRTPQ